MPFGILEKILGLIKIYPEKAIGDLELKDFGIKIPPKIKNLYEEVIWTYNNKMGVLCAAGIRAVLEGICNEKNIEGGKVQKYEFGKPVLSHDGIPLLVNSSQLNGKIEGLAEHNFITKSYAQILHNLRFLGNQAVHQLDRPSDEHLKLAIDIIEHTLTSIYAIEVKAEGLKVKEEIPSNEIED